MTLRLAPGGFCRGRRNRTAYGLRERARHLGVLVVVGLLTGLALLLIPLGVLLGQLVAMILFGSFVQAASTRPSMDSRAWRPRCWRTCEVTGQWGSVDQGRK